MMPPLARWKRFYSTRIRHTAMIVFINKGSVSRNSEMVLKGQTHPFLIFFGFVFYILQSPISTLHSL